MSPISSQSGTDGKDKRVFNDYMSPQTQQKAMPEKLGQGSGYGHHMQTEEVEKANRQSDLEKMETKTFKCGHKAE